MGRQEAVDGSVQSRVLEKYLAATFSTEQAVKGEEHTSSPSLVLFQSKMLFSYQDEERAWDKIVQEQQ